MNKKGFTLIELLGSIIIILVLSVILIPSLITKFKETNKDVNTVTSQILVEACKMYVDNNEKMFSENGTYCVQVTTLINEEYLADNFDAHDKGFVYDKNIKVEKLNNDIKYTLVNKTECSS